MPLLQSEANSLASVILQDSRAPDTPTAQQGGACAIIGRPGCFLVNQAGQVTWNLNLLKGRINISQQINEARTWHGTHLLPGYGTGLAGCAEMGSNLFPSVGSSSFYAVSSLCRSLTTHSLPQLLPLRSSAQLFMCEVPRAVTEEQTVGPPHRPPPKWTTMLSWPCSVEATWETTRDTKTRRPSSVFLRAGHKSPTWKTPSLYQVKRHAFHQS